MIMNGGLGTVHCLLTKSNYTAFYWNYKTITYCKQIHQVKTALKFNTQYDNLFDYKANLHANQYAMSMNGVRNIRKRRINVTRIVHPILWIKQLKPCNHHVVFLNTRGSLFLYEKSMTLQLFHQILLQCMYLLDIPMQAANNPKK